MHQVSSPVSLDPGTKETGATTTLEELLNTTLQHIYSLVIIAHYKEGEPRENINLHKPQLNLK